MGRGALDQEHGTSARDRSTQQTHLLDQHVQVLGELGSEAYIQQDHTVSLDQQWRMLCSFGYFSQRCALVVHTEPFSFFPRAEKRSNQQIAQSMLRQPCSALYAISFSYISQSLSRTETRSLRGGGLCWIHCRTVGLENAEDLVAGDNADLGDTVGITEDDTDLGGSSTLLGEPAVL